MKLAGYIKSTKMDYMWKTCVLLHTTRMKYENLRAQYKLDPRYFHIYHYVDVSMH